MTERVQSTTFTSKPSISSSLQNVLYLLLWLISSICADPWPGHRNRNDLSSVRSNAEFLTSPLQLITAVSLTGRRHPKAALETDDPEQMENSRNGKMWPPWPFNMIGGQRQDPGDMHEGVKLTRLFFPYVLQQARATSRHLKQVGGELWFHLPPATPPMLLLASLPRYNSLPAIFANSFARNLGLASLGVGIMSWAHSELNRKRRLTLLPLPEPYRDYHKAFLPHFLPEEVPTSVECNAAETRVVVTMAPVQEEQLSTDTDTGLWPGIRKHFTNFYKAAPKYMPVRSSLPDWFRHRETRKVERKIGHRAMIYDELVALQALKTNANKQSKRNWLQPKIISSFMEEENSMGYALVTGASRGIGRALAVELARWEIPLILVARDVESLMRLGNDIQRCYGVKCIILPADLSRPDAAEKIHIATREAGLRVDILVNNAGISTTGPYVDMDLSEIQKILQVNAMSVASLSHLFCRDMKERRRGRLLMVSSVVGNVPGAPNAACYAATKSFEKVLSVSLARELEPFGVGVTCLMPGAVGDTSFRSNSQSDEALCWKIPFYPRSAQQVARQGVRAMLAGDVEVVPGWQNRIFLKVFQPILPQRLTTLMVETAWNPFTVSWPSFKQVQRKPALKGATLTSPSMDLVWPDYNPRLPPQVLQLADTPKVDPEEESTLSNVPHDSVVGESSLDKENPLSAGDSSTSNTTQTTQTLEAMSSPSSYSNV